MGVHLFISSEKCVNRILWVGNILIQIEKYKKSVTTCVLAWYAILMWHTNTPIQKRASSLCFVEFKATGFNLCISFVVFQIFCWNFSKCDFFCFCQVDILQIAFTSFVCTALIKILNKGKFHSIMLRAFTPFLTRPSVFITKWNWHLNDFRWHAIVADDAKFIKWMTRITLSLGYFNLTKVKRQTSHEV